MPDADRRPETTNCPCCHADLELDLELVTEPGAEPVIPKRIHIRFVHPESGVVEARRYALEAAGG